MPLRPDELASESRISRSQERDRNLKSGAKTAINIGATALGVGAISPIASKILPFLSEYITPDLAIKGISKLSPKIGDFLKKGMEQGLNIKDGFQFLKDNLGISEPDKDEASSPQDQNVEFNELWSDFNSGKQQTKDPLSSMFLKVAHNLRTSRGLSSKDQLMRLYQFFQNGRAQNVALPQLARELFQAYDQNEGQGGQPQQAQQQTQQGQPNQQQGLDPNVANILSDIRNKMNNLRGR